MPKFSATKKSNLFNSAESLLVISSIGGSVASLMFQQVAFVAATSLSLSLAVSLNSHNSRKRLYEVSQQHQAVVSKLEQQYSKEREFINEAIRYLPNRSEKVEIDSRMTNLEAYKNEFTSCVEGHIQDLEKQIYNSLIPDLQYQFVEVVQLVNQLQTSTVESRQLHQHLSNEIQFLTSQFQVLDNKVSYLSSLDTFDLNSIHHEIKFIYELLSDIQQQTINSTKLTDDSLLLDLQHQLGQTQQLFHHLKANSENSEQLIQHLAAEIQSLQEQVQFISINVSKRLETVQIEFQSRSLALEKSDGKIRNDIYELSNWYTKLSKKIANSNESQARKQVKSPVVDAHTLNQYTCEHCRRKNKNNLVKGGDFHNYNFCSFECKREYERMSGLL